eukprot:6242152-Prymnesium_polylepis.1
MPLRRTITFARAYSPFPCCSPSRASIFTGRYAESHGVLANGLALPADTPTLGQVLAAKGWHTALVGKWHVSGDCYPRLFSKVTNATPPSMRHGFSQWAEDACVSVPRSTNMAP